MNLNKMTTYLVGAIDRNPDCGIPWRQQITPCLRAKGVTVFDPNDKPFKYLDRNDAESRIEINLLKSQGKFKEIREKYAHIRTCDLRMVDKADFLICRIDTDVHTCGTIEEIVTANRQKKPILIHLVNGFADCPNWLILMLPHQFFFDSMESLKEYLDRVDQGLEDSLNRWYYYT